MIRFRRPDKKPFTTRWMVLGLAMLSAVLAVSAGYYHQRWQNQVKRTQRLQRELNQLTQPIPSAAEIDRVKPVE